MSCTLRLSFPTHAFESSRKTRSNGRATPTQTPRHFHILCLASQPKLEEEEDADHVRYQLNDYTMPSRLLLCGKYMGYGMFL